MNESMPSSESYCIMSYILDASLDGSISDIIRDTQFSGLIFIPRQFNDQFQWVAQLWNTRETAQEVPKRLQKPLKYPISWGLWEFCNLTIPK